MEEANAVQKKTETRDRELGYSTALLAKYSVYRWNQNGLVWKEHTVLCVWGGWKMSQHTNIKTSSTMEDGLLSWTKNWISKLSGYFAGKPKTICPLTEAQKRTGDATGQRPPFRRRPVRVLTITQLRCSSVTPRDRLKLDIPRLLLNCNCFEKTNCPKCLMYEKKHENTSFLCVISFNRLCLSDVVTWMNMRTYQFMQKSKQSK